MAEGSGGCFGGAGQLPEGLLLPCTQVGGQEWRPPPCDCVALLIVVFCWLLLLAVVAPVSGVGCWALLCAVVSLFFVLIRALSIKIMLFTLVINVLVLTKF